MIDYKKIREMETPKIMLEIADVYNGLYDLGDKLSNLKIPHNINTSLDELDVIMKALLHDEMLNIKAYSEENYDTLPESVWILFGSAHLKRHWRLGAQPK